MNSIYLQIDRVPPAITADEVGVACLIVLPFAVLAAWVVSRLEYD